MEMFHQSLQLQANYAPAYVGLADSYLMLAGRGIVPAKEVVPQAKAAALKALEINGNLGEAHASLAHIRLHDWDWKGLDEEFRRAIELNPANAFSYYYYSEYLMAMGRPDESIAIVKKVQQIDPVSPIANVLLPSQYYLGREYEAAVEELQKALELNPNYFLLHFRLGQIYIEKKMNKQAVEEMQKAVDLSGHSGETLAGLGQAYAAAGMRKEMQAILDELDRRAKGTYVSPYYLAKIYGSGNDAERAFVWLGKAYGDRCVDLIELKIEPAFDRFHGDPRFTDLLRRVGWTD
jgi:tetratricopeptide (TPR) repeat protein